MRVRKRGRCAICRIRFALDGQCAFRHARAVLRRGRDRGLNAGAALQICVELGRCGNAADPRSSERVADRRAGIRRDVHLYAGCKRSVGRAAQRRYGLDRHGCGVTACKRTARAGGNGVAVAARRADIARRDGRAADLVAQRCRTVADHAVDVHRQRFAEADAALVRRRDVAQQLVIDGHRP